MSVPDVDDPGLAHENRGIEHRVPLSRRRYAALLVTATPLKDGSGLDLPIDYPARQATRGSDPQQS